MRTPLIVVLAVSCLVPSWASEPGEPLDCSDWVFLEPGLSCSTWAAPDTAPLAARNMGSSLVVDNLGRMLFLQMTPLAAPDMVQGCPDSLGSNAGVYGVALVRYDGVSQQTLGYIDSRLDGSGGKDLIRGRMVRPQTCDVCAQNCGSFQSEILLSFDPALGRVLIPMHSFKGSSTPFEGWWIASIEGFATTFEIRETYTPVANEIGFRVPYIPEGFQFADHFDTYYGDLATVGDWSQAQPLECGYPATAPAVGDYLTVTDTLPELKLGEGRYYVTAVTHQGETRYGRKSSGGVLTGRDPALLPGCTE